MNKRFWEQPVCLLCDYWWVLLILLVLGITAYFTRDYWMPPVSPVVQPMTTTQTLGTGDVQVTLRWNGPDDLDLWVYEPDGASISYQAPVSAQNGTLDVDANVGCAQADANPVENIFWPVGLSPQGNYRVEVNYFQNCHGGSSAPVAYEVVVLVEGVRTVYSGSVHTQGETKPVTSFQR